MQNNANSYFLSSSLGHEFVALILSIYIHIQLQMISNYSIYKILRYLIPIVFHSQSIHNVHVYIYVDIWAFGHSSLSNGQCFHEF